MQYWLLKTEPSAFSIDDLKKRKKEPWNGVRNYQARNYLRAMEPGDLALIYHSSIAEPHIAGVGKVTSKPYPDKTQFTAKSQYYEPRATKDKPIWSLVDVSFVKKFSEPVYLDEIKRDPVLKTMVVAKKGIRLSVQPVLEKHFKRIVSLGK